MMTDEARGVVLCLFLFCWLSSCCELGCQNPLDQDFYQCLNIP